MSPVLGDQFIPVSSQPIPPLGSTVMTLILIMEILGLYQMLKVVRGKI